MFYLIEEKDLIKLMAKSYYEELADLYVPTEKIEEDIQEWGNFLVAEEVNSYEDIVKIDALPRWKKNKYIMPVDIRDTSVKTMKDFYKAMEKSALDGEVNYRL